MKKQELKRVIIAILGATNTVFGIFIPIAIALLLVPYLKTSTAIGLWIIAILSSIYRSIDIGFLRN